MSRRGQLDIEINKLRDNAATLRYNLYNKGLEIIISATHLTGIKQIIFKFFLFKITQLTIPTKSYNNLLIKR